MFVLATRDLCLISQSRNSDAANQDHEGHADDHNQHGRVGGALRVHHVVTGSRVRLGHLERMQENAVEEI